MTPGPCSTSPQSGFSSEMFGVRSWNHSCSLPKQQLRMRCPMCAGLGLSDTKALKPTQFNLLKTTAWSCLVHLREWLCFHGEWQCLVLWTKKAFVPNNAKAEVKQCSSSSDSAVPHLLAWLGALGFSRKCQEQLMPHLLTRKYSFSTHTYRKLLSLSCHTLEAFLRKNSTSIGRKATAETLPKGDVHLECLPSEFASAQAL